MLHLLNFPSSHWVHLGPNTFLYLCIRFLKNNNNNKYFFKKNLSFIFPGTLFFIFSSCFIAAIQVTVGPLLLDKTHL